MRRLLTGLLGATLLLGACGDDDADDTAAVTSIPGDTSTSTSSTTQPPVPPPDVIPSDPSLITEEYVEQVLDALYEVSLEALLLVRDTGLVGEQALALVEAIRSDETFEQSANDLIALSEPEIQSLRESPAPLDVTVLEVREATTDCVVAEIVTDASPLLTAPPPTAAEQREFVRLLPASEGQHASGMNPTAWALDQLPVTLDGSAPPLKCP